MRLPRTRLASPGAAGAASLAYAGPVVLGALLIAGVWCAWAWTRPLTPTDAGSEASIPPAPVITLERASMDQRADRLARLSVDNPFDDERAFWRRAVAQDTGETDQASSDASNTQRPALPDLPINGLLTGDTDGSPRDIPLTAEEDLTDDVKNARANLELRGLFTGPKGTPVAMIGFKQGTARGATTPRRPGEHFIDEKFDKAPWVLARIQTDRRRVVLVRSGATVALDLYPDAPLARRPEPAPPTAYTPDSNIPSVQTRSREQIVQDLRDGGVSEADIIAALQLMDLPTDDIETPVTIVGRPEPGVVKEEDVNAITSSAPSGLEGLLKMMSEATPRPEPDDDEPDG